MIHAKHKFVLWLSLITLLFPTYSLADNNLIPLVPGGFTVDTIATEPHVTNPCVMAFDQKGRLFIGQGPQWRGPTPKTQGDRVDILIDDDNDGKTDRVKTFAKGFNSIQGLAWRGNDLYVANAPDLTIVRDLDNDDIADEYIRLYTGLGNLEHSLHGLNFAPDGKLYMSKGNSRGYNTHKQLAPKAFRELWGLPSPEGAPDYPPVQTFTKDNYQRNYHTPADDWGRQGGILRADPDGKHLEIISRGFRNPWDITYDDGFNWFGTDNDQTQGDKLVAPFYRANFGWGHTWSYHWTGHNHLPTVPTSGPLFEGSGAGVIHYHARQFPEEYQNVFFVNDWLQRKVYLVKPEWTGAQLRMKGEKLQVFAHAEGARTMPRSAGRLFDPTDIEVGPDGALYILSWGRNYGGTVKKGKQTDEGRVYRIRYTNNTLTKWQHSKRDKPLSTWTIAELLEDFAQSIPTWRTNAQLELIKRAKQPNATVSQQLTDHLSQNKLTKSQRTWILWTLAQSNLNDKTLDEYFTSLLNSDASLNDKIQSIRILAHRVKHRESKPTLPNIIAQLIQHKNPRLRFEAIQAIHQSQYTPFSINIINQLPNEEDRIAYYAAWNALRDLLDTPTKESLLQHKKPSVRLAGFLALTADEQLKPQLGIKLRHDADPTLAELAESWVTKTGAAKPLLTITPPPGDYNKIIQVTLTNATPNTTIHYTLDGSTPVQTSAVYKTPITINKNTSLKAVVIKNRVDFSKVYTTDYTINQFKPLTPTPFITNLKANSPHPYRVDYEGLALGNNHYTDRQYVFTKVPDALTNLPYIQTANNDDRTITNNLITFESTRPLTLYLAMDTRIDTLPQWMQTSQKQGFQPTDFSITTTDSTFKLYRKSFPPGKITLGGNMNKSDESPRGNYLVILDYQLLQPQTQPVTMQQVLNKLKTASPERGRELFIHTKGAGCITCHQIEKRGNLFGPDLSQLGENASAEGIIESILKPSATITEGFSLITIEMKDGGSHAGIILQESALNLKLALPDGSTTDILKNEIKSRHALLVSPMPPGYSQMMSPQQIADITAWLMSTRTITGKKGFWFKEFDTRLDIYLDNQHITTYLKSHPVLTRRALVNFKTPSGIQVTRNFPPKRPEDIDPGYTGENGIIHPHMHPGLWIGFGDLNGHDYWRLKAKVIFDGFTDSPKGTDNTATFTTRNHYYTTDQQSIVCTQTTTYKLQRIEQGLLMNIDAHFKSDDHDFYFGDQEESGLAVRIASPLRVTGGNGTILNDRGEKNGQQIWGKPAKWMNYGGTLNNKHVGVMIVPNPENPRPSWLHARDYGVVAINPFPKQPKERRQPYVKTHVKQGTTFKLSYAVIIYEQPTNTTNTTQNHQSLHQQALESYKP